MIRAHRVNATAQDDASLITGWNIAPNIAYTLQLLPGTSSCGVLLWNEAGILLATGAALTGPAQPCLLTPQIGQALGMVDTELGWHLLLTTSGTESQRAIRIGPAVDLPDEIHPVYGDENMALARATVAIDEAAHYRDDVTATCHLGLGAGLGDIVSVPVDGVAVVGQVESITWTATPDGTTEQAVIRRHVAIAPEPYVEPIPVVPPVVADDAGATDAVTTTNGNVLTNDGAGLTVSAVNGLATNVGVAVAGNNGGVFTLAADGSWTFDPGEDFGALAVSETADTSVTYHASDGQAESSATLTVTVSAVAVGSLWTPAEIQTALWLDAADAATLTIVSGAVNQWGDKSGNSRHAAQATISRRPVYDDDGFNSLPTIVFSAHALMLPEFMSSADMAIFFVGQSNNTSAIGTFFMDYGSVSGKTIQILQSTSNNFRAFLRDAASVSIVTTLPISSANFAAGMRINGQTVLLDRNGIQQEISNPSYAATTWEGTFKNPWIGAFGQDGYVNALNGKISEVVAVFGTVSDALFDIVIGYLAHKWGLAADLPSDHPYKSTPPTI